MRSELRRGALALMVVAAGVCMVDHETVLQSANIEQTKTPPLHVLLDAYLDGQVVEAVVAATRSGDFDALYGDVRRNAPPWISKAQGLDRERRRRVAALFALESVRAAIGSRTAWAAARPLLEWGCVHVRDGAPDEFERLWLLASLALLQGADDWASQLGRQAGTDPYLPGGHIGHARRRFPHDPRLQLAPVIAERAGRFVANRPRMLLQALAPRGWANLELERTARRLIKELQALESVEAIASEARIRRGILLFHLGDVALSVEALEFEEFDASDPFVTYVGHLTAGLALESLKRNEDARPRFRAAREAIPGAFSAAILFGTELMLAGQVDEAEAVVAAALASTATDPWREFRFGDYRKLPGYLDQLRRLVGQ